MKSGMAKPPALTPFLREVEKKVWKWTMRLMNSMSFNGSQEKITKLDPESLVYGLVVDIKQLPTDMTALPWTSKEWKHVQDVFPSKETLVFIGYLLKRLGGAYQFKKKSAQRESWWMKLWRM
jgi:hypothetical protein